MIYNQKIMKDAQSQTLAEMISFAADCTGGRVWNAIERAIREIKENKSFEFDGVKLSFVSRTSGKTRVVTAAGCHDSCDCGNLLSYHQAAFKIFDRYNKIVAAKIEAQKQVVREDFSNSPYFPAQLVKPSKREKMGSVWI